MKAKGLYIDFTLRRIWVTDYKKVVDMNKIYSNLMEIFDRLEAMDDSMPMQAMSTCHYRMINDWILIIDDFVYDDDIIMKCEFNEYFP